MAKSLLKKAKKAAKSAKKEVKSASSSTKSKVSSIRAHIEKNAALRRDCEVIKRLITDNEKYKSDEDIINLCKLKEYDTLLGEISS